MTRYELKHMLTVSGVGLFSAAPAANLSFNEMLAHLRKKPMDEFMHRYLFEQMAGHRVRKVEKLFDQARAEGDEALLALLSESCQAHERLAKARGLLRESEYKELAGQSPLVNLRHELLGDKLVHNRWIAMFQDNIHGHEPLVSPGEMEGREPRFVDEPEPREHPGPTVAQVLEELKTSGKLPKGQARPPVAETAAKAVAVLEKGGFMVGPEMGHKGSLARVSLLRHWMLDIRVKNGGLAHSLSGIQTSYGRGFEADTARASYLMEMVERVSSFASVGEAGILHRAKPCPLTHGSRTALCEAGLPALDLHGMRLEVPYQDQPLWWLKGETPGEKGYKPMYLPAQLAYLFMNLDEPCLVSGVGSTGLASGNTLAEARRAALLEVIERDAEAVAPFREDRVFRPVALSEPLAGLLAEYEAGGVHLLCCDLTPETGVPCYKAFVTGTAGDVVKGTAAGLSGPDALVSAITEIPYPFPGPPTRPVAGTWPERRVEELPDYSTGSAEGDVAVLETTLSAWGFAPVYADLSRADLGFPVARALIPGMEFVSDFDRFSRVPPRLYRAYKRIFPGT